MSKLFKKNKYTSFHQSKGEVTIHQPKEIQTIEALGIMKIHDDIRDGISYLTEDNYLKIAWYFTSVLRVSHERCIGKEDLKDTDNCIEKFDKTSNASLLNKRFNNLTAAFKNSKSFASAAIFEGIQTLQNAANIKYENHPNLKYQLKYKGSYHGCKKISIVGINCTEVTNFRNKILNSSSNTNKEYSYSLQLLNEGYMKECISKNKGSLFQFTKDVSNICMEYIDYNTSKSNNIASYSRK